MLRVSVQGLKEEIDSKLSRVQEIRFEPRLLSEEDDRLKQGSQLSEPPFVITPCVHLCRFLSHIVPFGQCTYNPSSFSQVASTTCTE